MKLNEKNRAILAEVIARADRETEFRVKLLTSPKPTLVAAGVEIAPGTEVVVLENTATVIYAILPSVAEQAEFAKLIELEASQITKLPEGKELRIVRDSASKFFVALPQVVTETASVELSDEALEAVAGGKGSPKPAPDFQTVTNWTSIQVAGEVQAAAAVQVVAAAQVAVAAEAAVAAAVVVAVAAVLVPCFIS